MKMRKLLAQALAITLWLSLLANLSYAEDKTEGDKANSSETVSKNRTSTPSMEEQLLLLNEKVRRLEELVEQQQRLIEALQPKILEANNSSNVATAVVTTTNTTPIHSTTDTTTPQTGSDEQTKKLDSLYKAFGQFTVSGDLRFRTESLINQGFDSAIEPPSRNRLRIRARVQLAGAFNNNFDWGIRVASGTFTNPSSTNQTFTDFFNRKAVGLDRYYVRYNTKTEPVGLVLQGGKFDYPWKRTELTFDNDIQPEGAAQTVYYKGKGKLKEAKLVAFELPFSEVAAGKDAYLLGGQLQASVGSGNWLFTAATTFLNFNRTDNIVRALMQPNTQVGGGIEQASTNRLRRDARGNTVGFVANYNILDTIGEITYNGLRKYPITIVLNYARNMSEKLKQLHEEDAYWTEFKLGRAKEKGDMELTYTFARVEQDAIVSVFSFDDFLPTNSRNNRVTFGYMVNNNVFLQFQGYFSQRINTLPGRDSRTQTRVQFDVNYRF